MPKPLPLPQELYQRGKLKFSQPPKLSPQEEAQFQTWMKSLPWWQQLGGNQPLGYDQAGYDYRSAWKAGIQPSPVPETGEYHWPSYNQKEHTILKAPWHKTVEMELKNWPRELWPQGYPPAPLRR